MGELLRNRVAVVTGSGRGLGRAHALALSAEGAKVVVNDVGVELDGTGGSKTPADEVVAEFASPLIVYLASDLAAGVNGLIFRAGSGKIELYSHPTVVSSVYRDWRKNGPWTIEELQTILPSTILSGETKAPFIP